jgi:hypothetical protein
MAGKVGGSGTQNCHKVLGKISLSPIALQAATSGSLRDTSGEREGQPQGRDSSGKGFTNTAAPEAPSQVGFPAGAGLS